MTIDADILNGIADIIESHIRRLDIGCGDEYRIPDALADSRKEKTLVNANDLIENLACWTAAEIIEKYTVTRSHQ